MTSSCQQASIGAVRAALLQAASYIYQCNVQALEDELNKKRDLPADWQPMTSNTELFEVPLDDPAVAGLVKAIHNTGAQVFQVRAGCWLSADASTFCLLVPHLQH